MLRNKVLIYLLLSSSLFAKEIIAVLDLEQIGLTPQEATILTQRLTTELISLDKYQVVERNNMDKILKEQKFQHSGCTDSECAVEIGQLLNSDYIIIGSVNKFGKTYAIDARLIDVGLGKGKLSAKFSMTGEVDALLTIGITSIAKQLCGMQASTTLKQSAQSGISTTTSSYGASIVITSDPPGAEIYIGGNYFDTTPQTLKDFPIGDYDVLLKLEGYEDYTASINLGRPLIAWQRIVRQDLQAHEVRRYVAEKRPRRIDPPRDRHSRQTGNGRAVCCADVEVRRGLS